MMRNIHVILCCFVLGLCFTTGLKAQPTPPDNKCDSLQFLNATLSYNEGTTALIYVFKNNSYQYITGINMKLEPTEMSGLILQSDESSHPDVAPGQTFSVFFFLENNLAELELNLDVAGEVISFPEENEFKCEMAYDKTFVNPVLSVEDNTIHSILLYPNPAIDHIVIPDSKASANYKLYDISGRAVDVQTSYNGKDWVLRWHKLTEGFYMLHESESRSYQKIWIR